MQTSLILESGSTGSIELPEVIFNCPFREPLVHQIITSCLANDRQGTRAQKSRADVRGGGRKPWRQKGTGRARASSNCSPLWRKGGVTFAARPQNYSQKINKKMYRSAMRAIFSELVRQDRLLCIETFTVQQPKTKALLARLRALQLERVLVVIYGEDKNLQLAARNLYQVAVCQVTSVTPVQLVYFDKVLMTVSAIKKMEEILA